MLRRLPSLFSARAVLLDSAAPVCSVLLLSVLLLTACSGGKTGASGNGGSITCGSEGSFCLVTCNLGCTLTGGCGITDIAQNQPLVFTFSRDVDPRTVDFTTFSLKTVNGEEPVGQFVVENQTISFIPDVRVVQGQTFYGFAPNLDYILTLSGGPGAPSAINSTSGQRLLHDYTCTLRVTRGVVDLDQRAPEATLTTPASTFNVPRDTPIVLEFSELIDFTPFFNPTLGDEPIKYQVRRSRLSSSNVLVCDTASRVFALQGAPRLVNDIVRGRTIATFTPQETLPTGSCVEVEVTGRVTDLSGRAASSQVFRFTLVEGSATEVSRSFDFQSDDLLDRERSGGAWAGGAGTFPQLGGDGRHGDFKVTDGQRVTDQYWIFNTDSQVITRKPSALVAQDTTVNDGRFYFTNFIVPAGITVEWVGSKPLQIHVRGECRIEGSMIGAGKTANAAYSIKAPTGHTTGGWPGQAGGVGGPGGGDGGNGAFGCDGSGNPNQPAFNNFNGFDGETLQVPGTHQLAGLVANTKGRGGLLWPSHGANASIVFNDPGSFNFNLDVAGGASGGAFVTNGGNGTVTAAGSINSGPNTNALRMGPGTTGGTLVAFGPRPGGVGSADHYLVGGSGGGGGASHSLFAQTSETFRFRSGAGGAGGGGAMLLRVGGRMEMLASAAFDFRGGSGALISMAAANTTGAPGVAGAGSGGGLLLQFASTFDLNGRIDIRGGTGGAYQSAVFRATANGGDGGAGFLRVETPGSAPALSLLGIVTPPAVNDSAGVLEDDDDLVGFQSKFVTTGAVFPPSFVRYVIRAEVDGVPRVFSDDPAVGTPARLGLAPLVIKVQGADVNLAGELLPSATPGPWQNQVGSFDAGEGSLNADSTVGYRWILLLDRTVSTNVVVRELRIDYRI
ncbi:MAG: Ig-like domain-containing protein [Planctomycetes bacterium]|nr:Ig-like domain-containing protein [Planctomycetota bacterium]